MFYKHAMYNTLKGQRTSCIMTKPPFYNGRIKLTRQIRPTSKRWSIDFPSFRKLYFNPVSWFNKCQDHNPGLCGAKISVKVLDHLHWKVKYDTYKAPLASAAQVQLFSAQALSALEYIYPDEQRVLNIFPLLSLLTHPGTKEACHGGRSSLGKWPLRPQCCQSWQRAHWPLGPLTPSNNDISGRWRRQDVNGQICSI